MLTINNNSLISGYIKQMLHDFNLPKAKVLAIGMEVFENGYYITQDKLYRAVKSGVYSSLNDVKDETFFHLIDNYIYGKGYLNITKNLELNSSIYDKYTHYYLGDYLRFYRDYKGIDLMSMYNCFGGEVAQNINLELTKKTASGTQEVITVFDSTDSSVVIYLVPARFCRDYTIAIDCSSIVEVAACLYSNRRISLSEDCQILAANTYTKYAGTSFSTPVKYNKLYDVLDKADNRELLYSHERDVYLMIKVPATNTSSLVVLEGDFTGSNFTFSRDFSWDDYERANGVYVLPHKTWYEFKEGEYIKVIDSNIQYYDAGENPVELFIAGESYHEAGKPSFTLSLDKSYYLFDDIHYDVGYSVNNTERKISYYLFKEDFPVSPSAKMKDNIFVDENTMTSYLWSGSDYVKINSADTSKKAYSRHYSSKMQLLYANNGTSYVFANKLVGYIVRNVITSDDNISDNIRRLQKTYYYRSNPSRRPDYNPKVNRREPIGYDVPPKHWGIWSQELRDMTYDLMHRLNIASTAFDIIGYVDKDAEKALGEDLSYDKEGHIISGGIPQ